MPFAGWSKNRLIHEVFGHFSGRGNAKRRVSFGSQNPAFFDRFCARQAREGLPERQFSSRFLVRFGGMVGMVAVVICDRFRCIFAGKRHDSNLVPAGQDWNRALLREKVMVSDT